MANIIGNTASDIYVSMSAAKWARLVTIPSTWNCLRIGIRVRMGDNGSGPIGTPRFALGLCSGTSNILGDATTTHFVGAITNTASWFYFTSTAAVYYNFTYAPYKRVGTTDTFGTSYAADCRLPIYIPSLSQNYRYLHYMEITKGSPNYSVKLFTMIGNNPGTDFSESQFYSLLTQPGAGTLALSPYNYTSSQTVAVNEGVDGTVNAVNCYWDQSFALEVHDW